MIRTKTIRKYQRYFELGRNEPRRLQSIALAPDGAAAIDAFHSFESAGVLLPTREPQELEAYLTGKEIHGITVKAVAEDFAINRLISSVEIETNYPRWVANEIFQLAKKIARESLGFVPRFIAEKCDAGVKTSFRPIESKI